ncbi:MAG: 4-hydroxy-tetrahydrodipicolinate synthase [Chloroflexi bacterium]|nr:4-hydroxy-tetrahydrodipicolinate synthase [Chloroflexota bacterium]
MTNEIGRVLTAMVTPFDADGAVDYPAVGELARALIASGNDGLVVTGTTGEAPSLTNEEQIEVWRTVRAAVGPDVPLVGGASTNATNESLPLVRACVDAGMDAVMLTVPYYNKPPQEGLVQHFTTLAEATPLPCILYNVPSRTSLNMAAETTLRLAEVPNIIGIKEASGDFDQIKAILGGAPEGFLMWSGNDNDTEPMVELGGYGVISVAGHLVARQIREMVYGAAEGRLDEARTIHERLLPLVDALFIESNPIPVKFALNEVGVRAGTLRLPLVPPSEATQAAVREELAKHEIDVTVAV